MQVEILNNEKNILKQDVLKLLTKYDPNKNSDKCQIKIDETETTKEWLETIELLFANSRSRIIKANIHICKEEDKKVVIIKLGNSESLYKEYLIGKYMSERNPNFMNYSCYFQCNNQLKKYTKINTKKYICNGKGDELKVLIMPYYIFGNFKDFCWNSLNYKVLISCTAQILASYLYAYEQIGFLHNDCHLGNVLIDKTDEKEYVYKIKDTIIKVPVFGYKIIIMDYETSIFDMNKKEANTLTTNMLSILTNCLKISKKNTDAELYFYKGIYNISKLYGQNNYLELVKIINLFISYIDE